MARMCHVESFHAYIRDVANVSMGHEWKLDVIRRDVFRSQRLTVTSRVTLAQAVAQFPQENIRARDKILRVCRKVEDSEAARNWGLTGY